MNNQSPIKSRIQEDMKNAMRAHEKERLETIRFLLAAIKQREVDERITLNDAQVLAVIEKQVKQHKDSIEQYKNAGRDELVSKETFELEILKSYLPEQLSELEIEKLIQQAIKETGASSARDMGKVMGILQFKLKGRADMGAVSAKVRKLLS